LPTTYTKAAKHETIHEQLGHAIRQWHPELAEVKATIDVLWASNADGPPLKKNRAIPALALVNATSLKERANGASDILLVIDARKYEEATEPEQLALLDHELEHMRPVPNTGNGASRWKLDDLNRPKLFSVPHDAEVGVFLSVAKRHKGFSAEAIGLGAIARKFVQLEIVFPDAPTSLADVLDDVMEMAAVAVNGGALDDPESGIKVAATAKRGR
jgi:hypothetical protein